MPFPWRVRLLIKVIERAALPQTGFDAEFGAVVIEGDGVRAISLDLDGVGRLWNAYDSASG